MKAITRPRGDAFEGIARECNGKLMSGQMVLRGGSVAAPRGHRRQFSGNRLAKDI